MKSVKLKIKVGMLRGARCVRATAIINKSLKLGIPRRFQKTWSLETVAPDFTADEIKPVIEAEAKRWEQKILSKLPANESPKRNQATAG